MHFLLICNNSNGSSINQCGALICALLFKSSPLRLQSVQERSSHFVLLQSRSEQGRETGGYAGGGGCCVRMWAVPLLFQTSQRPPLHPTLQVPPLPLLAVWEGGSSANTTEPLSTTLLEQPASSLDWDLLSWRNSPSPTHMHAWKEKNPTKTKSLNTICSRLLFLNVLSLLTKWYAYAWRKGRGVLLLCYVSLFTQPFCSGWEAWLI